MASDERGPRACGSAAGERRCAAPASVRLGAAERGAGSAVGTSVADSAGRDRQCEREAWQRASTACDG